MRPYDGGISKSRAESVWSRAYPCIVEFGLYSYVFAFFLVL